MTGGPVPFAKTANPHWKNEKNLIGVVKTLFLSVFFFSERYMLLHMGHVLNGVQ
jgi:hypothetical protein